MAYRTIERRIFAVRFRFGDFSFHDQCDETNVRRNAPLAISVLIGTVRYGPLICSCPNGSQAQYIYMIDNIAHSIKLADRN